MKLCPVCGYTNPYDANYCSHCGYAYPPRVEPNSEPPAGLRVEEQPKPRYDIFMASLVLSLLLSFVLIYVFHLPVFIIGLFLPFFWQMRPWRKTKTPR